MKIQLLSPSARIPKRQTDGAAGYDLYIPEPVVVHPGRQIIPLGFKIEIPKGMFGTITPRSGFSAKGMEGIEIPPLLDEEYLMAYLEATEWGRYDIDVLIGRIDSDYRGEVGVIVHSHESHNIILNRGQRIAQMIFQKYEEVDFEQVDSLSETERGEGGFQSTGA